MGTPPDPSVSNAAIVDAYDRLARPYDLVVAPLEAGTRRRAIESLDPTPGERVLEIGCGPGHALTPFADGVGPNGQVVGLDAAAGMIERARRRVARSEHADSTAVLLGDARQMPVADDSVDVVFIEDTLELFTSDERRTVLGECARVLAPDGRLGVVTMERAGAERTRFVRLYEWLYRHVPGYDQVGCRPIYACRALSDAGFTVTREIHHRRGYVWPVTILTARRFDSEP